MAMGNNLNFLGCQADHGSEVGLLKGDCLFLSCFLFVVFVSVRAGGANPNPKTCAQSRKPECFGASTFGQHFAAAGTFGN